MAATKKRGSSTTRTTAQQETKSVARKGAPRTNSKAKANGSPETKKTSPAKTAKPKPKTAAVKLTEKQVAFLRQIKEAGETGYEPKNKNEQRSLDALLTRKVIKRGAKNKETGNYRYLITKAGEKHLNATATA